jgi:hypothetical protein
MSYAIDEKIVKSNGRRGWVWLMIECLHLEHASLKKFVVINASYFSTSTTHFGFYNFHLGINISCKKTYEIDNFIMNC